MGSSPQRRNVVYKGREAVRAEGFLVLPPQCVSQRCQDSPSLLMRRLLWAKALASRSAYMSLFEPGHHDLQESPRWGQASGNDMTQEYQEGVCMHREDQEAGHPIIHTHGSECSV